jgi:hypothetical protein
MFPDFSGTNPWRREAHTQMAQTPNQRRASDAIAAWLAGHHRNPAWLVDETSVDPSTIGDFLNGIRWPKLSTQGKIEAAVGWEPGTIRRIGNGSDVPPFPETVGGGADHGKGSEEDTLLYRRPEGLTDGEWEQIKRESRGFIEWQIQRALQG